MTESGAKGKRAVKAKSKRTATPEAKQSPEKMNLESMDIAAVKRVELTALLKTRFPELVREDGVNFDQLKRVLGEAVESGNERFGLQWHGKAECMRVIQQPSIATLKPARDESAGFDKTENLFIEGDNLEVLKLLQRAYFGKVKMIYIDPPYNTGKEFIYPDKYGETLDTYLRYTGQVDGNGSKFSTNTETAGRYHSNWLNMMYPRLYLARNLLRDDGVIFISIDDNEQSNLKALCNEIFGEENSISCFIWHSSTGGGIRSKYVNQNHEYCFCYAKNKDALPMFSAPLSEEAISQYKKSDKKGKYREKDFAWRNSSNNPNQRYGIESPDGSVLYPKKNYSYRFIESSFKEALKNNLVVFKKNNNESTNK